VVPAVTVMRVAKCIVAIALAAALILGLAYVWHGCASFSAWKEAARDNVSMLLLGLVALRFLYVTVYDLLALASYGIGLEPRIEWVPWLSRGREPKTIKGRFAWHIGNVLWGVFIAYVGVALAVRCG